jgi:hypothetical protein
MNKEEITNIDGKFYKEANIVMLATNDSYHNNLCIRIPEGYTKPCYTAVGKPQHLYALSNEEIKVGQPYITVGNRIVYWQEEFEEFKNGDSFMAPKPIIVSTDELLKLPRFSNDFLKKYCELGGIDKVLIEYVGYNYPHQANNFVDHYDIKVASDNTVSIKPLVVKDSWNRDEIINLIRPLLRDLYELSGYSETTIETETDKWIEENIK